MTVRQFLQAIAKFLLGVLLVGLLVFLPAGTLTYFQGWLLMGVLFVPMFVAGVVMMAKNPQLLAKRLSAKEKEKKQSVVVKLSGLMFIVGFVLAGLDWRYSWLVLPWWVSIVFAAVFLLGYVMYAFVLKENTYLSRTVEVQENQKVIDTGLYAVIRHPMYTATILLFLSMPLILGSLISLAVFLTYPVIIIARLKAEEDLLSKELAGYTEYMQKVKYRLIPFIW